MELRSHHERDESIRVTQFRTWLEQLVAERYGSNESLAKTIGLTNSGFLRAKKTGKMSTESLLRLARETGRNASEVLTLAGKADVATLIESQYGKPRPVAAPVRELFDLLEKSPAQVPLVLRVVRAVQEASPSQLPGDTTHLARAAGESETPRLLPPRGRKARS
jgi:hypothetical protein